MSAHAGDKTLILIVLCRYEQAQGDVQDLQQEIHIEKEELLEAIRETDKQIKVSTARCRDTAALDLHIRSSISLMRFRCDKLLYWREFRHEKLSRVFNFDARSFGF